MASGLEMSANYWPGEIHLWSPKKLVDEVPSGLIPFPSGGGKLFHHDSESEPRPKSDVLTGLHTQETLNLSTDGAPVVLTSEVNLGIRLDLAKSYTSGLGQARLMAGLIKNEPKMISSARRASGIQCNGFATWSSYSRYSPNPMEFHDHRILEADVTRTESIKPWNGDTRLQVAFSGRVVAIKGPQFFIKLAQRAFDFGLPADFHVLGSGADLEQLKAIAPPNVTFHGFIDFETEWKSLVREKIDLMVLPHVQGDPSCTYFESLGSGVPVLGFDNQTMTPIARKYGAGWAVHRGNVDGLYSHLTTILANPTTLAEARQNGLNVLRTRTFEAETARRMEHILSVI